MNLQNRLQNYEDEKWLSAGAGEGNRTLVCSLGSCRSTIELRPRRLLAQLHIKVISRRP
jgi:hypothetical protein